MNSLADASFVLKHHRMSMRVGARGDAGQKARKNRKNSELF
jgi:hypothetical protein